MYFTLNHCWSVISVKCSYKTDHGTRIQSMSSPSDPIPSQGCARTQAGWIGCVIPFAASFLVCLWKKSPTFLVILFTGHLCHFLNFFGLSFFFSATSPVLLLRWVEEILHHLGWLKPYKWWDKPPVNWCRISSIHSRIPFFGWCLAPQCEIYVFHELIFTSPWPLYGEVPDFFRGEIHIAKISSQILMVETPSYP